jgi:hypothetical protein
MMFSFAVEEATFERQGRGQTSTPQDCA